MNRLTGFKDIGCMLRYATIICGGNLEMLVATSTTLTSIEEWLFYFTFTYGRAVKRLEDATKMFRAKRRALKRVLHNKKALEVDTRRRWPLYASWKEDVELRSESWERIFPRSKKIRPVMHDMTNLPLMKARWADLQRALYSKYYNGCVAKGGIFSQQCGWQGTFELWTGAGADTQYVEGEKIFELQEEFVNNDPSSKEPFLNIFDKGYLTLLLALHHGQHVLQPFFARDDEKYNRYQVLHSAAVAAVRSGNEGSVRQMKSSWMLKMGCLLQWWEFDMLADVWLAWGFRVNFMYSSPV